LRIQKIIFRSIAKFSDTSAKSFFLCTYDKEIFVHGKNFFVIQAVYQRKFERNKFTKRAVKCLSGINKLLYIRYGKKFVAFFPLDGIKKTPLFPTPNIFDK